MVKQRENKYDKVLRENLVKPSCGLIRYLLSIEVEEVIPIPPVTRQTVIERETDTIVIIKANGRKPFILHLEFQSTNDRRMCKRMAVYDHMLHLQHDMEVIGVVVYIGNKKLNMRNSVTFNGNSYSFKLIDIRNMNPELLLQSDNPRENILSILSVNRGNREFIINKIITKLQLQITSESEFRERIREMILLAGLREVGLQQIILKEVQKMPIHYDVRKFVLFQMGKSEGKSEGKHEGIIQTARNLLKNGVDITLVHKCTKLKMSELKKLAQQNKVGVDV